MEKAHTILRFIYYVRAEKIMKQKRADRLKSANSRKTGIRCPALIVFCFALTVFLGIFSETAEEVSRSFDAIEYFSHVPVWKNCSGPELSEKDLPEEVVVRFDTGRFLSLGGKQNSHEIHYRIFICGEALSGTSRIRCQQSFFRTCPLEQRLSFQTLLSATQPVRGSPAA